MNDAVNISEIIETLAQLEDGSFTMLAARVGVSQPTLSRWRNGKSRPRPDVERRLRSLAEKRGLLRGAMPLFAHSIDSSASELNLRSKLSSTLRQVRELLHSEGRLSSRHEALDEISKLMFAHFMSIDTGGPGISKEVVPSGKDVACNLTAFVNSVFKSNLPTSLAHELSASDFELRIKPTETIVAERLVACFAPLATEKYVSEIRDAGSIDFLNDAFGQFLTDSFTDEKELGQYLTPPEVVKFMVELGVESLSPTHLNSILKQSGARGSLVLDPSCGVGSFIAETLKYIIARQQDQWTNDKREKWILSSLKNTFVGIDKSERMIKLALTNMALFGAPMANLHLRNAIARSGDIGEKNSELDGNVALILTNPPFGAEFDRSDVAGYRLAEEWSSGGKAKIDSELLFFERYIDWLAPGGVLVAVVPDSILTNQGMFAALRKGISHRIDLLNVVSLPPVTFAAAGTSTKTSIVHLRRNDKPEQVSQKTYFAVCGDIGFDVVTRGSQRTKFATGANDLAVVRLEIKEEAELRLGQKCRFDRASSRWDAIFNVGLPQDMRARIEFPQESDIRVGKVASLINDRVNPIRYGDGSFAYIEISDIHATTCTVSSKQILNREAPSRARKKVSSGDVLISTVRPERRSVGIVPAELDGAICSTGIAVLRPFGIEPLVLARAIQSDVANAQLLRNNVGIAYPAIDESCLESIVLPITQSDAFKLAEKSQEIISMRGELEILESRFASEITAATVAWITQG